MDGLRMGDLLARRLRERGVEPGTAVSVAELHKDLLPYTLCRKELGLATKAEYDVALLGLLAEGRALEVSEAALRKAVGEELDAPEPGLAFLQRFAASELRVPADAEASAEGAGGEGAGWEPEDDEDDEEVRSVPPVELELGVEPADLAPGLDDPMFVPPPAEEAVREGPSTSLPRACRACGEALPDRDRLRFCPHCGANQWEWPCEACGAPVERGWRYCPICGKLQAVE